MLMLKIGGPQQGSGIRYKESRKKWWRKEFRELNRINKYLDTEGWDSRKRTCKRNMERRRKTKRGKLCSNYQLIRQKESCEDIRKEIFALCIEHKGEQKCLNIIIC